MLLPPGAGIFPNFHSFIKPKAMHAYDPANQDQWGIFIGPATSGRHISDPVGLTEVTSLALAALGESCSTAMPARERLI